ncbi:3-hydroxybutyryl-CoA dehydrogenase [Lentibacillus halophilus]|uniref:3-hydroxybutyryl-CoA dehydrogenase n=1 Tax=Lentibacillus halophilus TaxID=295065 RepID=A0ABP3J0M3_9BACI
MAINHMMVVGSGQMGSGIAQVCAQSGYHVYLYDANKNALDKGMEGVRKRLTKAVEKTRISEHEKQNTMDLLQPVTDIDSVRECDLAIEAIVENLDAKTSLFNELDARAPDHAILATNTSSLPITEMAAATNRPEQFIGMHFMNPVPVMKLVEVIRGLQTSDATYQAVEAMATDLSKSPVEVDDAPAFAANRILMPMINEAIFAVHEGVASVEDVDTVMTLGMNHPMGPMTLADFIGLDTCLYIMEVLYDGYNDSKYRPCPLLKKYVHAGWLGKKAGRGFYQYD